MSDARWSDPREYDPRHPNTGSSLCSSACGCPPRCTSAKYRAARGALRPIEQTRGQPVVLHKVIPLPIVDRYPSDERGHHGLERQNMLNSWYAGRR
jgi:hypothetical protein